MKKLFRVSFFLVLLSASLNAKRADVILNDELVPLGQLEAVLTAEGFDDVAVVHRSVLRIHDMLKRDADLVVILGGRQSVTRLHENPEFYDQISLIRSRHAGNRPTLGLCLGAQMMALAFGGRVVRGPIVEQGWVALESTSEQSQAVMELVASGAKVYASHEDIIEAPQAAVLLAKSELYNHIFAVGKQLAIQFHPEATPQITQKWLRLFFNDSPENIANLQEQNEIMFVQHNDHIVRFLSAALKELEKGF